MTRNESETADSNQLDSEAEEARRQKHGSMREAQDAAAGDDGTDSENIHDSCPLCGHPMGEHTIDRSHASAVLNCPVPPNPEVLSSEPLNEVGMIKRRKD